MYELRRCVGVADSGQTTIRPKQVVEEATYFSSASVLNTSPVEGF